MGNPITCCFTGHRSIPVAERTEIAQRLAEEIQELVRQGVKYFGAGGALGFDTLAAKTVLSLKTQYPHIKLILVLPCRDQADRWNVYDKKVYNDILERADKLVYTAEQYASGCMHRRNRHLVEHSDVCVCYCTKNYGGTAYTVNYAIQRGLRVINLA